jgi:hypothetical protein
MKWRWSAWTRYQRVDALAADAAEALAEAFKEFLFPDAADADAPQA